MTILPCIPCCSCFCKNKKQWKWRKWFPPPLRKLSQGKVEKSGAPDRPPLKKTPSDKKVLVEMGNKPSGGEEEATARLENGEEGEDEVELPPPMKPIQEPLIVPSDETPGEGEQHTEKLERHSSSSESSASKSRQDVLRELVATEQDYVRDLGLVVHGYMKLMKDKDSDIVMPEGLSNGKDKMVFGNLEAIYDWHRERFLGPLEECLDQPEKLGALFKKSEQKLLHLASSYCKHKPIQDYIVGEYNDTYFEELRIKLGHRLTLADLLMKPVQRIMKYHLLIADFLKHTERAGITEGIEDLRCAFQITLDIPKAADDMMNVSRLRGFDGSITAQGKLLIHGNLQCADLPAGNKFRELHVFLFEQSIIFSEAIGKKTQFTEPSYNYKAHIQVNKMSLRDSTAEDLEACRFLVESTDRSKSQSGFSCVAPSKEKRTEWVQTIRVILHAQRDFIKALQSPIAYQKELTKEISCPADYWNPSVCKALSDETRDIFQSDSVIPIQRYHSRTPSPTKNKLNFLDNMKNVLGRSRSKEGGDELAVAERNGQRRHTEHNGVLETPLSPGSIARVVMDFKALRPDELHVRVGDVVGVVALASRGYLVRLCYDDAVSAGPEGWVPAHVLSSNIGNAAHRKPWSFRFRKPSVGIKERNSTELLSSSEPPTLLASLHDVLVAVGDRAQLTCRIRPTSGDMSVTWRFGASDCSVVVRPGGRFTIQTLAEGDCSLSIDSCKPVDAGQYTCTITNSTGSVTSTARLTVRVPEVEEDDGGSADWQAEQFRRRYELLLELGRGRMSIVSSAKDRGTGHVVAVKQVLRSRQSTAVTRAEYNLLATLRHAHLPRALALFVNAPDATSDSIVMELAKESLLECISRHNDYSEKIVCRAMRELTSALACLHNHNALHLDIRPENILVDGNGSVKLVDLGEGVRRLGVSGAVLPPVTLEFAAPELVLGKSAAASADLWSLGVFLYVFLSGVSPFLDESVEETTGHILQGDFFFSDDHFANVSAEAKSLITGLLQTPPHLRGTAATTLLHPWFQKEKTQVWPTERLRLFLERRRSSTTSILSGLNN